MIKFEMFEIRVHSHTRIYPINDCVTNLIPFSLQLGVCTEFQVYSGMLA